MPKSEVEECCDECRKNAGQGQKKSGQSGEELPEKLETPKFDPRFPNTNQTLNCYINYVDYYRCLDLLRGSEDKCEVFKKVFTSLCPNGWVTRWDEQREAGTFPHPIIRVPEYVEDKNGKNKNGNGKNGNNINGNNKNGNNKKKDNC